MPDVYPEVTRLRYFTSKNPDDIQMFLIRLGKRVQIYGCPQWDGKRWWLWFVPDDRSDDIRSVRI